MSATSRASVLCALVAAAASIGAAQQLPAPPTNLRIIGIEPVIWGVTVSGVTASQATISWTTDILSDSQVQYGPTASYGSLSALHPTLVTSHSVTLTGLSSARLYHFSVRSRDAAGSVGLSTDYTFTTAAAPDTTVPVVSVTAPASGATVSGTVAVSASASDNVGVAGVQFKVDGVNVGAEDTVSPYSVSWNTTGATNGSHALTAVARDAAGNTTPSAGVSVTVSNADTTAPTVSIGAPSAGATVSGTVTVSASASDNRGVVGVQFKVDGVNLGAEDTVSPYSVSWNTTGATNGSHALTAVARDAAGNTTTSAGVSVSVSNADTTAPTVSIGAPSAGTTVSGTVTVSASAGDNRGVVGIQFKVDGVNLGAEDTTAPYSVSWNTTSATNGSHALTAVARDAAGNATTSAIVSVTVSNLVTTILTLSPQDTSLNLNTNTYSTAATLTTYTWPNQKIANAIVLKFDLASLPLGAVISDATLHLALVESDASTDPTYTVSAHRIFGKNPVVTTATGYTFDGVNGWTANTCCNDNIPLAQADISAPYAAQAIDKTLGFKQWNVTALVQEWAADPLTNFGLLLNSDATKLADRYRFFASMEHLDSTLRPYLRVTYTIPPPDPTFPSVSITAPSPGATVSGTISVTASASDNVGVTSVQFKVGGVNLGSPDTTAPYSVTWNTTTVTNGSHTLTAVARDAAGNTSTSAGVSVAVSNADTTAPTVSIAAPTSGATVSGTVTVSAGASDNVAVAGVQFKLDGVNLGAEDATSPYSVSWDTTKATNGSHSLTAVARDAAGNQTTSAGVTVTVSNTTSSGGIAALYPGDVGIENHPDVLFVERFDDTVASVQSRWTDVKGGSNMTLTIDRPSASPSGTSLRILGGPDGGHLYKNLAADGKASNDVMYVRYYIKYPSGNAAMHEGIWMGGYNPPLNFPSPGAGSKPTGSDRFSAAAEDPDDGTGTFDTYNYWMGMRRDPDGNFWGNQLTNNPNLKTIFNQWMCVEQMVKLNNPVTAFNGEHAIWVNGSKVSHLGPGFPNGHWVANRFYQTASDSTTFEGFQWRNTTSLNLNYIWLQNFTPHSFTELEFDHVVVAKSYIGCLTGSAPSDTTAPTISGISATGILSNSATINWTTNEAADSRVQYGPSTSYGNSTSLDASLVTAHRQTLSGLSPSTLYHYRVISTDAAGNVATSGDNSFTTAAATTLPSTLLMSDNMEGGDLWDHPGDCALSTARNHTIGGSKSMACDASNDNGYANRFKFSQTFTGYTSFWWWAPNGMNLGTAGITSGHGHFMRFFFGNSADDRQLEAYADLWNQNAPNQGGPQGWQINVVGPGGVWAQETFGLSPTFNILDGQWHHIEMFVTINADGQSNGVFKVWVDGVLTANFINKKFQADGYSSRMTYPFQITTLQVPSNLGKLAGVVFTDDVEWYSGCPSATLFSGTPSCVN